MRIPAYIRKVYARFGFYFGIDNAYFLRKDGEDYGYLKRFIQVAGQAHQ